MHTNAILGVANNHIKSNIKEACIQKKLLRKVQLDYLLRSFVQHIKERRYLKIFNILIKITILNPLYLPKIINIRFRKKFNLFNYYKDDS